MRRVTNLVWILLLIAMFHSGIVYSQDVPVPITKENVSQVGWVDALGFVSLSRINISVDGQTLVLADTNKIWLIDVNLQHFSTWLTGYTEPISDIAFSPDGASVVSGSENGKIQIWDTKTHEQLHLLEGHEGSITSVQFSPDSTKIVSGSTDGTVRIWNAKTGEQLLLLEGHLDWVNGVGYSPDGGTVVSGSTDQTVRIWNATTGEPIRVIENSSSVTDISISEDGNIFSTSIDESGNGQVKLWSRNGDLLKTFLSDSSSPRSTISLDGSLFASDSKIGSTETGERTVNLFRLGIDRIFSPDNKLLFSISDDHDLYKLILDNPKCATEAALCTSKLTLPGPHRGVNGGTSIISPDGSLFLTGGDDSYTNTISLMVWDMVSRVPLTNLDISDVSELSSLDAAVFSPNSRIIATATHEIRLWDAKSGKTLGVLDAKPGLSRDRYPQEYMNVDAIAMAFSPDSKKLVASYYDSTIRLWDLETDKQIYTFTGHSQTPRKVAFSSDGTLILSASRADGSIRIWDVSSGKQLHIIDAHDVVYPYDSDNELSNVQVSPIENLVALAANDGLVHLWDLNTGKEKLILTRDMKDSGDIKEVMFTPDGKRILSRSEFYINLWDVQSGKLFQTLFRDNGFTGMEFLQNGDILVTYAQEFDNEIVFWNTDTGEQIFVMNQTPDFVSMIASPGNEYVIISANDKIQVAGVMD